MDIDEAKRAFKSIISSLRPEDQSEFLSWCEEECTDSNSAARFDLRIIAEDIKTMIPWEAILPSENICPVNFNNNSCGSNEPIVHVDSFLYDEDDIDKLVDEGKLKRNYCRDCGSFNVSPITFISHSASIQRIEFIFQTMLPDLTNKVVLDIGSRLGAVLYGAYYFSQAKKIIGVEMNEDMCKLQRHIVHKYNLSDRIEIICDNICNVLQVVQSANVIILNNVFECFMPKEVQKSVWMWLRNAITVPGTILITVPSLEETFSNLQIGIDIATWLRQVPVQNQNEGKKDDPDLFFETFCYVVL